MEDYRLTCCVAALIWSWVRVSVQYFLTSVEWNGRFCCSSSKDRSITLAFVGSGCIYLHWSKIIQIESSYEVFKDRQYKHQRYNCWIKIDCSKMYCCKRFLCWVLSFRVVQRLREKSYGLQFAIHFMMQRSPYWWQNIVASAISFLLRPCSTALLNCPYSCWRDSPQLRTPSPARPSLWCGILFLPIGCEAK